MNSNTFHECMYLGPSRKLDKGVLGQVWDPTGNGEVPHIKGRECVVRWVVGTGYTIAPVVIAMPAPQVAHCILSVQREDCPVCQDTGVEGQVRNQTLQRRNRAMSWGGKEKGLSVSAFQPWIPRKARLGYETATVNKTQTVCISNSHRSGLRRSHFSLWRGTCPKPQLSLSFGGQEVPTKGSTSTERELSH